MVAGAAIRLAKVVLVVIVEAVIDVTALVVVKVPISLLLSCNRGGFSHDNS